MCENTDSRCTTASSKPRDPLMNWRFELLSFAYFSLQQAKKSRCLPRTGATLIDQYQIKERPTP
jgi:hypothetical protein